VNTQTRGIAPSRDGRASSLIEDELLTDLLTNDDERGRTRRYEERRNSEVFAV
jgi:hypothetical protein